MRDPEDQGGHAVARHVVPDRLGLHVLGVGSVEVLVAVALSIAEAVETELAGVLNVTKGAISQTVNKLQRKKLVRKTKVGSDNREIVLLLTDLGWKGYRNHEELHLHVYDMVRRYFGDSYKSRLKAFTSVMSELNDIMNLLEQEHQQKG